MSFVVRHHISVLRMPKAKDIRLRLQQMLKDEDGGRGEDLPPFLHAIEWMGFAQQYDEAAGLLSRHSRAASDLPRILLSGHSVECALKACLAVRARDVPRTHNLVALADLVIDLGFVLYEPELLTIVHLDSVFHEDLVSETRFRVRYPTEQFESSIRDHASQPQVARIVESLISQASRYNEHTNRKPWSAVSGDA